ncbi:hypothetical protein [Ferruginibacter paludis]|uniref:hypothetical protein n=1 Tax=Ferruginibacter paludis TaxID=1310417 RepID=UPI0025B4A168|nr:hypothetical protein [Ferruginibacter paludis]
MEKLHFYFFCFYNSLYKDGFYLETYLKTTGRGKILPERRTILGLFFSTWLWTIVLRLITIDLLKQNFKILFYSFFSELIIAVIIYAAYFYYFVDNNRFANIYAQYKSTDKIVQRQGVKKVYWFLGLPLLLIPLILWWTTDRLHIDLTK